MGAPLRLMDVFLGGCVTQMNCGHQATFGMVEDVAMDHPIARAIIELYQQLQ